MNLEVILYAANIVDYLRLILLLASVFFTGYLFAFLYSCSIILDFFDGQLARRRNEVSALGATLDMIIDRVSTMVIPMKISLERIDLSIQCVLYSVIDLVSHFLFFLASAYTGVSHKSLASNIILSIYYGNSVVGGVLCLGSELCFISTYLYKSKTSKFLQILRGIAIIKTLFHVIHFVVAVGILSKIKPLVTK